MPLRFWVWTAICSMLPDIDVISFAFGIRYEDMLGHRGFTHSIFFAAMIGAVAAWQIPNPKSQIPSPKPQIPTGTCSFCGLPP